MDGQTLTPFDCFSITSLTQRTERGPQRPVDFSFGGRFLGGDRCVRANMPFSTTFHVAVFKRKPNATARPKPQYHVGVVGSGYFEISITRRDGPTTRIGGGDMTSIGLATSRFNLVGKQPGWDRYSYGYHGDDGHFFHHSSRVRPAAPRSWCIHAMLTALNDHVCSTGSRVWSGL